jgi:nitrogen-specific signal transduction histidine kinase/CheY-like chemotaxis protein
VLFRSKERSRKDLKKSEERLIQSKKLEALGILAGGIAHDFNNLLGAMLGNAEICREVVPESSLAGECLDDIIGAIARAKDLVRQVLDFSQASDSRKDRMILAPLVKELAKKMREDLPDTIFFNALILKEWDAVWGNPVQLRQVFVNLWQNAVQAMAESGGTLTVAMDDRKPEAPVEPSGAWLCLSVSDTGHGMAEDIRQRIFEPYFSAWKERTASGMGLAAAYGIVDGHGGMIEVHSEEGKGSVFRVFLPVCERGEKSDMPVTGTLNGNIRVFIVDDEEPVLKVFHRLMKSLGNDFIGFRDPVEALAYFTDNPSEFDLVLTDFLMPGMNGLELVRKIRKTRPDIPAILCTGRGDEMDRCLADEAGINMFLQKPFTKKQLAEAMARVVRDRR